MEKLDETSIAQIIKNKLSEIETIKLRKMFLPVMKDIHFVILIMKCP